MRIFQMADTARIPFQVNYRAGHLTLSSCCLPAEQKLYLQSYLEKVNRYKVIGFFQGSPVFSIYQPPLATPAGIRSIYHRLRRRFFSERIPATATIAVNKACQCHCTHCSANFYNQSVKRDWSTSALQSAILQSVELGVTNIILLGGEPLLRGDLHQQIRMVPPEKAVVTMFTNGEYLTLDNCRRLKEAGLMGAFVSFDSVDAAEHDRLRHRKGLFHWALEGVENLKKAGILAAISTYLSHPRLAEGIFEKMMDFGKDLGVQEVTFFDAIPTGEWLGDETGLLTVQDRIVIQQLVGDYRKKNNVPGLSVQSTMTSECGSAFCFAANTQFYLSAFGDMCPCDFTPLTIGRFPERSIAELWKTMIHTPPYDQRAKSCRMQDSEFRKKYIETIPKETALPYPLPSASALTITRQ